MRTQRFLRFQHPLFVAVGLVLCLQAMSAFADCKANYTEATSLLDAHLQKTGDKTADADAFETSFRASVGKLQTEKCLPELMSLIQHIQSEQQKHPVGATKPKTTPIVD